MSPHWEAIFSTRGWGEYPGEDLIREICRRKPAKVLEIGCGPGANLWLLARKGIPFDAIDGSPTAVRQAQERLNRETPGWAGRIEAGDFAKLPPDFTGYALAIDSQALSCVSAAEARAAISEIRGRLLPGGALWSRTFAPGTSEHHLAGGVRTTERDEIPNLYGDCSIGEITRQDNNGTVREWIITTR